MTREELIKQGYWEEKPNCWIKPAVRGFGAGLPPRKKHTVKKGRSSKDELPVKDSIEIGEGWCKITLAGLAPGLNGSHGLMNEHWAAGMKRRDEYVKRVALLNPPQYKGEVKLTYTRYCSILNDWDNHCASFKKIGDAIKNNKIIEDDSPLFIVEFLPKQFKCRRKDARTIILIEQI